MTLLSIVHDALDLAGMPRPATVAGNSQPLARQSLAMVNETVRELGGMEWPLLTVAYQFNTAPGQDAYDLPADYGRKIANTLYVKSEYYRMRGSMTPADWQRRRNSLPSAIGRFDSRIYGNPLQLFITPAPATVETVVYEYMTKFLVMSAADAPQVKFLADTDTSVLDEELITKGLRWRIKKEKGFEYAEDFNDYEVSRYQQLGQQLDMGEMPVAYRTLFDDELYVGYIPESGFGV